MKKILFAAGFGAALVFIALMVSLSERETPPDPLSKIRSQMKEKETPSADHTQFTQLKRKFKRPQEVTAACISCHTERHKEVMNSSHWNWERLEYVAGKGIRKLGKKNILNNFCIGISGNEQSCNKCHAGYGWGDENFNFQDSLNVDCLACHDNSDTYVKAAGGAGMPDRSVDLTAAAQYVGTPKRSNCGVCHFYGGGGNNVKHGDLEMALFEPLREVDVHMASAGENMQCVDCHTARNHQMLGKMYSVSSMNRQRVACDQCHTSFPHTKDVLNMHLAKVACQTCHIPRYAKVNPTKMYWDWSTAGKLKEGKPFEIKDSAGMDSYLSIKGTFTWGKQLIPDYIWFNGTASHYLIGDSLDPLKPVRINELFGSANDPGSKIFPVKIFRAKQIYDTRNRYLIQPKTVSTKKGDGGYWSEFNWQRASEEGMKRLQLAYSGHYDFVETEMTWPVNHMVSPREQAVKCEECHTRSGGRLAHITGSYLPGRDYHPWIEFFGNLFVFCTIAGVLIHGSIRIISSRVRKKEER